jgi:hypothetical protein
MPWTPEEIAAIELAYKSGVTEVQFKDRRTRYRSLGEMERILSSAGSSIVKKDRKHYEPKYERGYQ